MPIPRDLRRLLSRMIGWLDSLRPAKAVPPAAAKLRVDPRSELSRDTVEGCRDRAASALQDADTSTDSHDRKQLRRGAKRWSLRADMLERLAKSFAKRALLDEASRQFQRENARHDIRPGRPDA